MTLSFFIYFYLVLLLQCQILGLLNLESSQKKKPVSIISFKTVEFGISGGVTSIGTIGALLGSSIIGLSAWLLTPLSSKIIFGIIFSGFFAAIFDSIIGATFQGKYRTTDGCIIEIPSHETTLIAGYRWIDNDVVNLINTLIAPILMYLFLHII